jgi:hypothetical protein
MGMGGENSMGYVMGICWLHVRSVKGTEKDEEKRTKNANNFE